MPFDTVWNDLHSRAWERGTMRKCGSTCLPFGRRGVLMVVSFRLITLNHPGVLGAPHPDVIDWCASPFLGAVYCCSTRNLWSLFFFSIAQSSSFAWECSALQSANLRSSSTNRRGVPSVIKSRSGKFIFLLLPKPSSQRQEHDKLSFFQRAICGPYLERNVVVVGARNRSSWPTLPRSRIFRRPITFGSSSILPPLTAIYFFFHSQYTQRRVGWRFFLFYFSCIRSRVTWVWSLPLVRRWQ